MRLCRAFGNSGFPALTFRTKGTRRSHIDRIMGSKISSKARVEPGPGQESVWDYPRPPSCQPSQDHLIIYLDGQVLADTKESYRVLETSHPPVYYIPPKDINMEKLHKKSSGKTYCEWKGSATYYDANSAHKNIGWTYEQPTTENFQAIKGYVAFYPSKIEKATLNGETVKAQEGDFYGGFVTDKIVGPFKGGAGTAGW